MVQTNANNLLQFFVFLKCRRQFVRLCCISIGITYFTIKNRKTIKHFFFDYQKDNQANTFVLVGKLNVFAYPYCRFALISSATMFKSVARPTPFSLLQIRRLRRSSGVSDHIDAPIFKGVSRVFDAAVAFLSPISHDITNYAAHSSSTIALSSRMRLFSTLSATPRRLVSSNRFVFSWLYLLWVLRF